jgi:glycosyltransferase involved in cell wall biosynthesis
MDTDDSSSRPIKLLMLSHYFAERRGGIELVAAALARGLGSLGFRLIWLATGVPSGNVENSECRRRSLAASNVAETLLDIPYPILLPSAWRTIFAETRRSDMIMVHDALYMTSVVACVAARVYRKPFVIVQHIGLVPYKSAVLRKVMEVANRFLAVPVLRRADNVIFISQLTMRYFASVRWRRTPALVFNGVDTDIFSPAADPSEAESARNSLGLPVSVPVALFVGRFVEKKGLPVLERIARARSDVFFAFAGQGTLDPARWGLPNVRVYTSLSGSSLACLYRASDLLLLPSIGEGFPLVVQEALASGLAIVCGIDTAQADSRATSLLRGIKVDLENPDQTARLFSEEMTRLLAHPVAAEDRRKRFEFAQTHYSWAASAAHYASLLQTLRSQLRSSTFACRPNP